MQKEAVLNTKKITDELALKNAQENESRLLSLSWGEVEENEKATWVLVKILNLKYFYEITAFMFILFGLVFFASAVSKAHMKLWHLSLTATLLCLSIGIIAGLSSLFIPFPSESIVFLRFLSVSSLPLSLFMAWMTIDGQDNDYD